MPRRNSGSRKTHANDVVFARRSSFYVQQALARFLLYMGEAKQVINTNKREAWNRCTSSRQDELEVSSQLQALGFYLWLSKPTRSTLRAEYDERWQHPRSKFRLPDSFLWNSDTTDDTVWKIPSNWACVPKSRHWIASITIKQIRRPSGITWLLVRHNKPPTTPAYWEFTGTSKRKAAGSIPIFIIQRR